MLRSFLLLIILSVSCVFYGQNYPDKIFTKAGDSINCKITLVNDKNIFYEYKKRKSIRNDYISVDSVSSYNWISKNITENKKTEKTIPSYLLHCFSAGISWLPDREINEGHYVSSVEYGFPSISAFYRLIYITSKQNKVCLNAGGNYRQGIGFKSSGGLGGGTSTKATFDIVRLQIEPSFLWSIGKTKGTNIGFGLTFGLLTYCGGTALENSWSINTPNIPPKEINVRSTINPLTMGINFEFSQQFRLKENKYLILGIRAMAETSDGYSNGTRSLSCFLGFLFGNKTKQ
ncbi:MAG: hypothetical protein ACXVPN_07145 [Bacteroidia bacterium]